MQDQYPLDSRAKDREPSLPSVSCEFFGASGTVFRFAGRMPEAE